VGLKTWEQGGTSSEQDFIDLSEIEAGLVDDGSQLGTNLTVDASGKTIESHSVDRGGQVHSFLEGFLDISCGPVISAADLQQRK